MELTQLKQFKVIAECESLTKAAERLYVSQPALSQSLSKLEKELGAKLFNRSKNSLALNEAGRLALKYAEIILDDAKTMEKAFIDHKRNDKQITVCSVSVSAVRYLVSKFLTLFPEIPICTSLADPEDMRKMLLSENCDIAFTFEPINEKSIISAPCYSDGITVSVPVANRLAGKPNLNLKELDGQNIIILKDNSCTAKILMEELAENAPNANVTTVEDYWDFNETIKSTDSIYFVSNMEICCHENDLDRKYVKINNSELNRTVYVAYLKSNSAKVKFFTDWLSQNCKNIPV